MHPVDPLAQNLVACNCPKTRDYLQQVVTEWATAGTIQRSSLVEQGVANPLVTAYMFRNAIALSLYHEWVRLQFSPSESSPHESYLDSEIASAVKAFSTASLTQ
jgi:hypothetical protein